MTFQGCLSVLLSRFKPVVDTVFTLSLLLAALQVFTSSKINYSFFHFAFIFQIFTGILALYGVLLIRRYENYDVL